MNKCSCHNQTGFNRENWADYFQNKIKGVITNATGT